MKKTLTIILLALIAGLVSYKTQEAQTTGALLYVAKISQEGTRDPEAKAFINELNGDIVWTRTGTGEYAGSLANAFPDHTYCAAPVRDNTGDVTTGSAAVFTIDRSGNSGVTINSYGTPEDGSLQRRDIEGSIFVRIEVYP